MDEVELAREEDAAEEEAEVGVRETMRVVSAWDAGGLTMGNGELRRRARVS